MERNAGIWFVLFLLVGTIGFGIRYRVTIAFDAQNQEYRNLEIKLTEVQALRDKEKSEYKAGLLDIVANLYGSDQYWVGGFDIQSEEGQTVEAIYSAIKNQVVNYTELLANVGNYFDARDVYLKGVPSIWPIEYNDLTRITSGFGYRLSPITKKISFHGGLDISGIWNAAVIAPADGEVIETWPAPNGYWKGHPEFGGFVKVRHIHGFETWYAHLSLVSVSKGDLVKQGERIGRMGNTGLSKGDHLHYEVWLNGRRVNPLDYLRY